MASSAECHSSCRHRRGVVEGPQAAQARDHYDLTDERPRARTWVEGRPGARVCRGATTTRGTRAGGTLSRTCGSAFAHVRAGRQERHAMGLLILIIILILLFGGGGGYYGYRSGYYGGGGHSVIWLLVIVVVLVLLFGHGSYGPI